MNFYHPELNHLEQQNQNFGASKNRFEYLSRVTIGDTNLLGNMYFTNHFKIQGVTRELWMQECVENAAKHLSDGLLLITKSAHCDYIKDFYLDDTVACQMTVGKIRKASFMLEFEFLNAKTLELHAKGYQEIVFADANHTICKMPNEFRLAASKYQRNTTQY